MDGISTDGYQVRYLKAISDDSDVIDISLDREIQMRLDTVQVLHNYQWPFLEASKKKLKSMPDLERGLSRMYLRHVSDREKKVIDLSSHPYVRMKKPPPFPL
jgi:hypothetical protein